jgi:glycosyltransferase involved in cell wall biosynthesis
MISILMPIYNGIEFISQSVNSILNQTFQDWELIIGINGHPQNSKIFLIAKKYENEKIKVLDLFTIKGKSNALNEMLKYAKYDWIALLDVDDIWYPNKLEKQIPFMNDYDIIGTLCQYFSNSNLVPTLPLNNINEFNFYRYNPIINSSVLLKKELCFWKEEWRGIEDYDLWLRLWKLNKKFYNVPSIEVLHRIHKQSAFNAKGNGNDVPKLLEWHQSN